MSFTEIWREVNHLHGAHKAVAFALQGMLFELSRPGAKLWVDRLRQEWQDKLSGGRRITVDMIRRGEELPITLAVLKESTRRHVVTLGTPRKLGETIVVKDTEIPAGTEMGVALFVLHHRPDIWKDPYRFEPGRFLPEDHPFASKEHAPKDPRAWMPFLEGPRKCAGIYLAHLQLAIVMKTVLENVDITCHVQEFHYKPTPYTELTHPVPFSVKPRK